MRIYYIDEGLYEKVSKVAKVPMSIFGGGFVSIWSPILKKERPICEKFVIA